MTRFENVARPFDAVVAALPDMAEVDGLGVRVTFTPLSLTALPYWSSTCTVGDGDIVTPATTFDGPCPNASLLAEPGFTVREKVTEFW